MKLLVDLHDTSTPYFTVALQEVLGAPRAIDASTETVYGCAARRLQFKESVAGPPKRLRVHARFCATSQC